MSIQVTEETGVEELVFQRRLSLPGQVPSLAVVCIRALCIIKE